MSYHDVMAYGTPLFSPYDTETPFTVFESPQEKLPVGSVPLQMPTEPQVDLGPKPDQPLDIAYPLDYSESYNSYDTVGVAEVQAPFASEPSVNLGTVAALKRAMADSLGLISLYTTLKTTYLKLCKEFNYLLQMFKENERIKMELIKENNELRELLAEKLATNARPSRTYPNGRVTKAKWKGDA